MLKETMQRGLWKRAIVALAALAVMVVAGVQPAYAEHGAQAKNNNKLIELEVAEDGTRFVFSKERLFEDGMPQYGTPFVTQGYLYPKGTLNGTNGALADGSPEFPDKVIGEWTCYGWMIGDGGHTTTGEWVISTQVFKFGEEYDNAILVTDGFELVDFNVPIARALTSGTGVFKNVAGEQSQTLLGFTEQMGVNLTVQFHLDKAVKAKQASAQAESVNEFIDDLDMLRQMALGPAPSATVQ
jgi:hypothetical protein